jgi:hypothetical protein
VTVSVGGDGWLPLITRKTSAQLHLWLKDLRG